MALSRLTHVTFGGKVSGEDDFISATLNASIARDLNQRNTTLFLGVNNEFDSLRPIGGAPVPGSDYASFDKEGNKTKDGLGVLAGLTQVVTRNWLSELNLSWDRFHGYLNDPYKISSVLDSAGNTLRMAGAACSKVRDRGRKQLYGSWTVINAGDTAWRESARVSQ